LNFSCTLSWILMRLCATTGVAPQTLLNDRATLSWGEVCRKHGKSWGELVIDVQQRQIAAHLTIEPARMASLLRSSSNHPESVATSGARP
jgi:hypothetical protein